MQLIELGAELESRNYSSESTPLILAAFRGNLKIVSLLLSNGARVDSVTKVCMMINVIRCECACAASIYLNEIWYGAAVDLQEEVQIGNDCRNVPSFNETHH